MQKLVSFTVLALILGLSSCDNGEDGLSDFSKTEAKAKISDFNGSATEDLQTLSSSKGLEALVDLSSLASVSDPFGGRTDTDRKKIRAFLREKGATFRNIVENRYNSNSRTQESEPFDFEAHKGVYAWNATEEIFVRTGDSDIIKIQFPTEGSDTNNAELQLKAYHEVEIFDEEFEEYTYAPTVLKAALLVDGAEAASLDMAVEYDEAGFPVTADFAATVVPFAATLSFDVSASDKNALSASVSRNGDTIFSTSVTVLYSGTEKTEADLKTISGFVELKDIKLEGTIDVEGMDAAEDEIDFNQFIKLTITSEGKKIGDIVFVVEMVDGYEEQVAYIQYADGTKEKLEDVLQPVIDELEKISDDLEG